jgi:hypothetical protein
MSMSSTVTGHVLLLLIGTPTSILYQPTNFVSWLGKDQTQFK